MLRLDSDPATTHTGDVLEIYLYSGCSSCTKADKVLAASGKPYTRRDYFKESFSVDELASLLDRAGVPVSAVVSTRSRAYGVYGLAEKSLTDSELLALMVAEPTLLRRPLILGGGKTVVGFNRDAINDLVERA